MKKLFAIVLVFAILFSFVACGKADALTGTWEGTSDNGTVTWTFKDGKCTMKNEYLDQEGTYELNEETGVVVIKMEMWDESKNYAYVIDGSSLTLTADDTISPNYDLTKK